MSHEIQLLLLLAIIIAVSKVAGHLSLRYLNQPVVFGEILAGVLLGPSLLNIFGWPIFPGDDALLHEDVDALAHIGVLLLMFVAGLETNLAQMRAVGRVAISVALCGVAAPLGLGFIVSRLFGIDVSGALFIGTVLTATSVSITAQTLLEIGRLKSREGNTILGAAVIDDILGIIVLSFVIVFSMANRAQEMMEGGGLAELLTSALTPALHLEGSNGLLHIGLIVLCMVLFFALAIFVGVRYIDRLFRWVEGLRASHAVPAAALVMMLIFAAAAEYVGHVAAITGAYLVGIFLGRTQFVRKIEHGIHTFTYALFVPVFFMSIGLGTDVGAINRETMPFVIVLIAVALFSKVAGCGLGAYFGGFTRREALRVGVGMISRGEVGLIIAQVGRSAHLIGSAEYAALVLMVLVSTIVTPVLLRFTFPRTPEIDADIYESVVSVETPSVDE